MSEIIDYIEWDERFMLGIPVIDKQHENLVRICNNLHWSCLKGQETLNHHFINSAHEAIEYVRHHFSTEEKMMNLFDYSEFPEHKKEHEYFVREILNCYKNFQDGIDFAPNHFVNFIKEWILSHITVTDKEFADFFLSMDHYGKLKLILAGGSHLSLHPA